MARRAGGCCCSSRPAPPGGDDGVAAALRSVAVYMISVWSERGRITAARRETDGGNPMVGVSE